jgi:hypothetical protein
VFGYEVERERAVAGLVEQHDDCVAVIALYGVVAQFPVPDARSDLERMRSSVRSGLACVAVVAAWKKPCVRLGE